MTTSTTRKLTGLKFAGTVLGAMAILAIAPATAFAENDTPTPGSGGCNYTDADGYNIPLDNGQSVKVDGKTVSCNNGTVTTTAAPKRNVLRPEIFKGGKPVLVQVAP